jgi:hypothetical protein
MSKVCRKIHFSLTISYEWSTMDFLCIYVHTYVGTQIELHKYPCTYVNMPTTYKFKLHT